MATLQSIVRQCATALDQPEFPQAVAGYNLRGAKLPTTAFASNLRQQADRSTLG